MIIRSLTIALCSLMLCPAAHAQEAPPEQDTSLMQASYQGLTVDAGETWIFRVVDGQPAQARKVASGTAPGPGELSISLEIENGPVMVVTNNDGTWYNYRAFVITKPNTKGHRVTVCTLMGGGLSTYEDWRDPVPAIRIADFTVADANTTVCR